MRTDRYRKSIYEEFAKEARAKELEWIVLHGIEGYPESIGRDLDSYCIDIQTIFRACELFEKVAKANMDTLYVIYPNPLWGKRVLAISKNYEVAELHILYRINSGIITYDPDFSKVKYIKDFPFEDGAMEFKAIIMSLLGNNKKVIKRMEDAGLNNYDEVLISAYRNLRNHGFISHGDRIRIYIKYSCSVTQMIESMKYSLRVKAERKNSATAPIFSFKNYCEKDYLLLKEKICEVFTDFKCADEKDMRWMIHHVARQEFVYTTNESVKGSISIDLSNIDLAAAEIVFQFRNFNIGNKNAIFKV